VADAAVGETITEERRQTAQALTGFKPVQAVVFRGLFPVDAADLEELHAAVGRLRLNDASFTYEMETSAALGSRRLACMRHRFISRFQAIEHFGRIDSAASVDSGQANFDLGVQVGEPAILVNRDDPVAADRVGHIIAGAGVATADYANLDPFFEGPGSETVIDVMKYLRMDDRQTPPPHNTGPFAGIARSN
jgi:hypothetical protein